MLQERDAYANEIIEELKKAELIVVEGTLYPLLTRLKNGGLLAYRWEESTSGPPRKYYSLTEVGKTALKELRGTWERLQEAVNQSMIYAPQLRIFHRSLIFYAPMVPMKNYWLY